jgi:hypothetical protein
MRTTLTLDADNAERLRELAHRTRKPFKRVLNDALRRGLAEGDVREPQAPYRVKAHPMRLRPGIDPGRLAQFESELDVARFQQQSEDLKEPGA